ncbi:MAG: hypothetical protein U0Q18_08185 [Bryobacteraceae bacterium]
MSTRKNAILFACLGAVMLFGNAENARATAPNVKYWCNGTFASPAISGNDLFGLAGEPFTVSIVVNTATTPSSYGTGWARYTKLTMTGAVQSRLLPTPVTIYSTNASIQLNIGPTADAFTFYAPVIVAGINITITSTIQLPVGTITKLLIYPFSAQGTMTPGTATAVYSNGTNSTKLGMNGLLNAVYIAGTVAQGTGPTRSDIEQASDLIDRDAVALPSRKMLFV